MADLGALLLLGLIVFYSLFLRNLREKEQTGDFCANCFKLASIKFGNQKFIATFAPKIECL